MNEPKTDMPLPPVRDHWDLTELLNEQQVQADADKQTSEED